MKPLREIFEAQEREQEAKELLQIIDKPSLTPEEIWNMFPNNFYKWRKKHDYPRILNHFNNKFKRFDEWKKKYSLTDELLMQYGISNCINKNPSKDKRKFIVERTWENVVVKFISYQNIDGKYYQMGPSTVSHKVISSFLGYLDWCDSLGIKLIEIITN